MDERDDGEVTHLLRRVRAGEDGAAEALFPLVYDDLREIARRTFRRERVNHTLQPTALVHEAWMRVAAQTSGDWQDRAHFLGIAARVMRQVLVDHARRKNALKRAGRHEPMTMERVPGEAQAQPLDVLALDAALQRLADLDARKARVVELRLFAGMTMDEVAEALAVSKRTAEGDWAFARAWLRGELDASAT